MKMIKRTSIKWIAACTIAVLLLAMITKAFHTPLLSSHPSPDMVKLEVEPYETGAGWGYKITAGGTTYINQDRIPVLPGKQTFRSKDDALSVGNFVVQKLMKRQSPAISQAELLALHIQY